MKTCIETERAQIDMLRLCQALPPLVHGEGFNAYCGMCNQPIDAGHHYMPACSCATQGCWECGAAVGEPGCEYCVDRASEVGA